MLKTEYATYMYISNGHYGKVTGKDARKYQSLSIGYQS